MHIPAMDSIRQERVGVATNDDDSVSLVLQAHVQTEDTEERGAYDPIEGMARPFPMMMYATEPSVLEPVVESAELTPFSDELIEYVSLLYQSAEQGEWVEEVDDYAGGDSFNEVETRLAGSLQDFVLQERPMTLWRTVYEKSNRLMERGGEPEQIMSNPLRDIEGRERYGFAFLPSIEDVDEWTLTLSEFDGEVETEDGTPLVAASLWLRYKRGDTEQERPLVAYHNEPAGYSAASPSVDFGQEMDDVDDGLIEAILAGEDYDSNLTPVDASELEGTRTKEYLEAYLEK